MFGTKCVASRIIWDILADHEWATIVNYKHCHFSVKMSQISIVAVYNFRIMPIRLTSFKIRSESICVSFAVSGYGGCETTGGTVNLLKKQVRVVHFQNHNACFQFIFSDLCVLFSYLTWQQQQQQQQVQPQLSTGHIAPASGDNYSYVQLTAVHEPVKSLHEHRPETIQSEFDCEPFNLIRSEEKRESCASIKKPFSTDATAQPHKELVHTKRVRCRYIWLKSIVDNMHYAHMHIAHC